MKTSMNLRAATASRMTRLALVSLALAVWMMMAAPLYAVSPISLHGPHENTNSADLVPNSDTGGLTDAVVWHFVLPGNWELPTDMQLSVTFASAGVKTATGSQSGGGTIHFYVGTPTHDVLLGGQATLNYVSAPQNPMLLLSHIAVNQPGEEPPGEEPPGEEPPGEEPPGEEPPGEEPPGEEPPGEEPPVTEEEPFLPFTETEEELVEKAEMEEFLPFTGGPATLLLGSALAALAGTALRRLGR